MSIIFATYDLFFCIMEYAQISDARSLLDAVSRQPGKKNIKIIQILSRTVLRFDLANLLFKIYNQRVDKTVNRYPDLDRYSDEIELNWSRFVNALIKTYQFRELDEIDGEEHFCYINYHITKLLSEVRDLFWNNTDDIMAICIFTSCEYRARITHINKISHLPRGIKNMRKRDIKRRTTRWFTIIEAAFDEDHRLYGRRIPENLPMLLRW